MKVFNADQIRAWDAYTIRHEPVSSSDLMDRASQVFTDWFVAQYPDTQTPVVVFAGTGNNGGDGLVTARLLHWLHYEVKVFVCDLKGKHSPDFDLQFTRLPKDIDVAEIRSAEQFNQVHLAPGAVLIDALFGSGLNRPLEGEWLRIVDHLNAMPNEKVAIDLPSGLFADTSTPGRSVVQASRCFSFEAPKRAFFFPENADRVGKWSFGSIGLHLDYYNRTDTPFHYLTERQATLLLRPRAKFSHKGSYGHALLISGQYGTMGAAVLAARACLRIGAGLLTVYAPRCGYLVLQSAVPEAMYSADRRAQMWTGLPDLSPYAAIGVGCGIGQASETAAALKRLLESLSRSQASEKRPGLVLDADALNLLAQHPDWWRMVPQNTILTPHPKEFERLFGKTNNDFERNDLQRQKAQEHGVFIVLKGAHTAIACPDDACWFNSTGNPGMATGGSGDVLTGIVTGLLAQGYSPRDAALLGVFLHGYAGDRAAETLGEEGMIAGDIADFLGNAWASLIAS
ncbi:MAG: NAD(P)H-hydrate dehydratase [Saprospiraceae bacterium]|nr:NAD(P)H-hydrate dehydratase [Saprospiraceae bacterium]